MFSQTFVDGTQPTRKPYTVALSLLLQISAIGLLILVPLLYTQTLPNAQLKSMLMAPPPPPAPPRPPVEMKAKPMLPSHTVFTAKLVAPTLIPKQVNTTVDTSAAPDVSNAAGSSDAARNGNSLLFSSAGPAGSQPPPFAPAPKPKPRTGPLRVGGVVAEANLIHKVQPLYPPLAKSARVAGTVEFTALISKEGRVENLLLVRGHPLLVNAAREAILQWQYRPTMLNGEPAEVVTDITVNFKLTQ